MLNRRSCGSAILTPQFTTWGQSVGFRNILMAVAVAASAASAGAAPVAAPTPAQGKALILVPLTLTKIDDLDFGTVVTSPVSGVVTINPATGARSFAGGVTGFAGDPGHRAQFAGAGTPTQQVIVFITPPAALVNGAGDTIPVLALTLDNGGNPIRTIDATRAFFVGVGGIIQINADQPEGVYSANFTVTANYL
jgi:hypothetical protein